MIRKILLIAALATGFGWGFVAEGQEVFINELHYDNAGTDVDEGIEIAGVAGTNLGAFSLSLYNGSGGAAYRTVALSGVIPNESGKGFGAVWFPVSGVQNDVDGVALVRNPGSVVVQHFAWEGSFTGVGGAADGLVFGPIGVSQPGDTPIGQTLQLAGSGRNVADFEWTGPRLHSRGLINEGQAFGDPLPVTLLNFSPGLVREGATATGMVSISPLPPMPVTLNLQTNEPGRVNLPQSVQVPVSGSAVFPVEVQSDGKAEGFQELLVWAVDASGAYPMAGAVLQIVDADRPSRGEEGTVRIMSLNVRLGIGVPGSAEFVAVREIVERVSPDVLVLQEVSDAGNFGDARALLEQAGFPSGPGFVAVEGDDFAGQTYRSGDFGAGECLLTASRFPVIRTDQIGRGVPGRRELTRFPLYTALAVPGGNLHVVNVHLKAGTADTDRFRKAVESFRIREFLAGRGLSAAADDLVVAGDFNAIDTLFVPSVTYSTATYTPPAGTSLPQSYLLGTDLSSAPGVLLPYSVSPFNPASSVYPHQGFNPAGLFAPRLLQADGQSVSTFNLFDARFDYLMVPQRWITGGRVQGEVYNSRLEPQSDGLPKQVRLPDAELSEVASDHYAVFLDILPQELANSLKLTVNPAARNEGDLGPPVVAVVSLQPPPLSPVMVELGTWRESRVRFEVDRVELTPSRPSVAVPVLVPFSPLLEPRRTVQLTARAAGFAPATAGLTIFGEEVSGLLVISQYVEPSAAAAAPNNNVSRAVELYNGSGAPLDLARLKWEVRRYTNGSTNPVVLGRVTEIFPEDSAAILPPGRVVVVGEAAVGTALVAAGLLMPPAEAFSSADPGTLYCNAAGEAVFLKGSNMDFNGDDALEVTADGVRSDVFGTIGQDPGTAWTGGPGNPSTADQNIELRPEILTGSRGFALPGSRFTTRAQGNSLAGIGVPPVPADRYTTWAAAAGLTGLARAPNSDPDGDGRLNLVEFVEATDPTMADPPAPVLFPGPMDTPGMAEYVTRMPDAWLSLRWERSDGAADGLEWAEAPEVTGFPEGAEWIRWQFPLPAAGTPRQFWRLRVERP